FLYQFGITAAVAILVSLVVSFTLTPMMSARLLHASAAGHGAPTSRSGLYGLVERSYLRTLAYAMRHRLGVVLVAGAVILSTVALYRAVRQEYVPSNVDEGEFNVNVNAPEGTSIAAMNDAMLAVEQELRDTPGVRTVLATAGGGFLGNVN